MLIGGHEVLNAEPDGKIKSQGYAQSDMINVNIASYEIEGWNWMGSIIMTAMNKKGRFSFWVKTNIFSELHELLYKAKDCRKEDETYEELVKRFLSLIEEKREHLEALLAESEQELSKIEAREKEQKADEEAFAARWFGCSRNHFSGKYMSYVNNIDNLAKNTWTEYDKYIIKVVEEAEFDWGYYAKSYHHPKKR